MSIRFLVYDFSGGIKIGSAEILAILILVFVVLEIIEFVKRYRGIEDNRDEE